MHQRTLIHRLAGLLAVTVTLGGFVAPAIADPGPGVTSKVLTTKRVGHTEYTYSQVTIPPGQSTGWHYHDGPVYAWVKQGTLTHDMANCHQDGLYHTGSFIVEKPGRSDIHIGRNLGTTPVVLDVLYVDPVGKALAVPVKNPGCSFD